MSTDRHPRWRLLAGGALLGALVALALLASGAALGGGKTQPRPKLSFGLFNPNAGRRSSQTQPFDTCSSNCSFPEGNIGLILNVTDSPCDGSYSFDVDPGDGTGLISNIPITGTCDTSQNPSVFTGSGQTTHLYKDESNGAYTVQFYWHDPDVGIIPGSLSLTITEGDSLSGHGINISVKLGKQFSGPIATFTDTPSNGYTAPASDMFASIDWNDGSPLDVGTVTAGGGGTFTVSGTHTYTGSPGPWVLTIKLEDDSPGTAVKQVNARASVRLFTATPKSGVVAGSTINYQGMGFNAAGSPIVIGWDDLIDPLMNTTLPAAASFNGTQTAAFGHPTSDAGSACSAKLSASQDGATDTVNVSGVQNQVILAVRRLFRDENGRAVAIQPPDFLCDGEKVGSPDQQPPDVLADRIRNLGALPPGAETFLAAKDYPISGADAHTVPVSGYTDNGQINLESHGHIRLWRGSTLCLPVSTVSTGPPVPTIFLTTYGSMTIPLSPQGPFTAGQIGPNCPSPQQNTNAVIPFYGSDCRSFMDQGTWTGDLNLTRDTRCVRGSGNLTVTGNVQLNFATLQLTGNLTIDGSITGTGRLVVNGNIVIKGSFKNFLSEESELIVAGGDVQLLKE